MKIGAPKETAARERRVALVPDVVRRLRAAEHEVIIESGAGLTAGATDEQYVAAGARIGDPWSAEVVAKVAPPSAEELAKLRAGSILVGFLNPLGDPDGLARDRRHRRDGAGDGADPAHQPRAVDGRPVSQATGQRLSRGADRLDRARALLPDVHDRGGTVPPAQVLVLGAGVAGLQAIATARRLGAVVTAFDIRSAVKEQIQSLGARFFEVEGLGDAEAEGGYARELTPEEQQIQRDALSVQMGKSDVIVTTALVPGRPAPKLIPASAVELMKPGSVIVDLAAEAGGNCELTKPGETYVTRRRGEDRRAAEPAVGDGRARVRAVRAQRPGADRAGLRLRGRGRQGRLRRA